MSQDESGENEMKQLETADHFLTVSKKVCSN